MCVCVCGFSAVWSWHVLRRGNGPLSELSAGHHSAEAGTVSLSLNDFNPDRQTERERERESTESNFGPTSAAPSKVCAI